jgi:hypothetical protein
VALEEERQIARTALNKQAGEWLRATRETSRSPRAEQFARALEAILVTPIAVGTLYSWERGDRTVPAAALLAASQLTGEPIALSESARKALRVEIADEVLAEVLRQVRERLPDV